MRHDPARVEALRSLSYPVNAGQLQEFLMAMNWMRTNLPDYSRTVDKLEQLLNVALEGSTSRNKKAATKVVLSSVGWNSEHEDAWENCRNMLQNSVTLAHVDTDKEMCVFTDAS